MHVISLYLVLRACAATFDVMCVKKNRGNQTGPKFILVPKAKFEEHSAIVPVALILVPKAKFDDIWDWLEYLFVNVRSNIS
jgi:hypothetical protein